MDGQSSSSLDAASTPNIWIPGIIENIARFVPQNDVATSLRLANKISADLLREYVFIKLSQLVRLDVFFAHWSVPGVMRAYTREQRRQFLCLVAASGSICNLEVAITVAELTPGVAVFRAAAAAGHLDVCKWLMERGFPFDLRPGFTGASEGGHVDVCGWLLDQSDERSRPELLEIGCVAAAHNGHVALIDWMLQRCQPLLPEAPGRNPGLPSTWDMGWLLESVASGCTLPVLQRLYSEWVEPLQAAPGGGPGLGERRDAILAAAASSPTPDWRSKVEWLEQQGFTSTGLATCLAAGLADHDALERLQWLRQRGYPFDSNVARRAAFMGNPSALEFVLSEGVSRFVIGQLEDIAYGGNLAVLQALHARGWISSETARRAVFVTALGEGHVHVAAWCVEALGCSVVAHMGRVHAKASLEMLTWLEAQPGTRTWHRQWLTQTVNRGCVAAVEWLVERGCPWPNEGGPYIQAAINGDLAMLRCLRRLGCPWGDPAEPMDRDISGVVDPTALRWLHEEGCDAHWLKLLGDGSRVYNPVGF